MRRDAPSVAVCVPVFNKIEVTVRFLECFQRVRYPNYTIVIADDGSTDGTDRVLAERYPEVVRLKGNGNLWWSGGTNLAVRYAMARDYDYVLTINNDATFHPDFLMHLVRAAEAHPRTIVGSRINFLHRREHIWATGGYMQWRRGMIFELHDQYAHESEVLARYPDVRPVEILTGCGTLVPMGCFREAGLYDERRLPQYHGDSEFVLRAGKHGYEALVAMNAVVYNDAERSVSAHVDNFYDLLFSKRSSLYLRAIIAIYGDYCPRTWIIPSMVFLYARRTYYSLTGHPVIKGCKKFLKRVLGRQAAIDIAEEQFQEAGSRRAA